VTDEQTLQDQEMEFHYPKNPWLFALFCHLIMLGLFTVFYYGKVPEEFKGGFSGFAFAYLMLVSTVLWEWPAWIKGTKKPILLGADGITATGKFAAWNEIEEVKHGPWFARYRVVRIKLKKQKRPFFEFTFRPKPRVFNLPAYPFVYRELIPAIQAIRPELPVSKVIERAIADPEGSVEPRRWLVSVVIFANIAFLTVIFLPRFQNFMAQVMVVSIWTTVGLNLYNLIGLEGRSNKERFIEFALLCPILVTFVVLLRAFSDASPIAAEAMIVATLTASVTAFFVLFAVKQLGLALQVVIVCILISVPMGVYAYQRSQQWPSKDINGLLFGDECKIAVWGNEGGVITTAWYDDEGCVVDSETLERRIMPIHNGKISVIWLNERFLIRRVAIENDSNSESVFELWVYDFEKLQEFKVPTSEQFSVGKQRPVDYTGRRLVWIDYEPDVQKIRFWNLEAMKEDIKSRELPRDVNWVGGRSAWLGRQELVVCVERADEERKDKTERLYVLRLNLEDGRQKLFKSSGKYKMWYPVGDFQYAFGINKLEHEGYLVDFVDLEKSDIKPLAGKGYPIEAPEEKYAFRVVKEANGSYLVRFEYENGEDKRVCRVPERMSVQGVSRTGRYVMVGSDEFFDFPVCMIIDVKNGRRHRINLSGISGARTPEFVAHMFGALPFSPDEHWFILETIGRGGCQTFLFEIPDEW
jgi:hypothetical protein